MTPERWRQIENIFNEVAECAPAERAAFLTQACGGDVELRREVVSLLAQEPGNGDFIAAAIKHVAIDLPTAPLNPPPEDFNTNFIAWTKAPATQLLPGAPDPGYRELVGRRIGNYDIIGLIGHGGMGAVYRAARAGAEFEQQVALKIVKRWMDSDFVRKRFRHERRILARLEHPNIARLLDGGQTEDGLPYFVMEYVEGQSITKHCAEKQLELGERLQLFRAVCAAVQYAHQNLVIHRDIKPGNILVTKDGAPKLLDFGIAKLLEADPTGDAPTETETAMRLMTPDYASPEQVCGAAISTASDVYSLGVVLYELLTGTRPHQFKNLSAVEIEKTLRDTAPEKPSAVVSRTAEAPAKLSRQLAGDLDNIVLMALRSEPERRYQSVEQFSEDIRRHLDGRPISARRDTLGYRAGKFVWRNKLAVGATLLVLLSLLGGIAIANYQARRAEQRFQQVRRLANTFLFDVNERLQNLPGSTETRVVVVTTALQYLDGLAQESAGDPALQLELARAYLAVGDLQGDPWAANLGHGGSAMESYRKALSLAQQIEKQGDANQATLRVLVTAHRKVGVLQSEAGEKQTALVTLRQGARIAEQVAAQTGERQDLALIESFYGHIGDTQVDTGDISGAAQTYARSLQWSEQQAAAFPRDGAQALLATNHGRLCEVRATLGDLSGAIESCRRGATIYAALANKQPHNLSFRQGLRGSYSWLGSIFGNPNYVNLEDGAAAIEYSAQALVVAEELAARDPKNTLALSDLAATHARLGDVLAASEPARALNHFRRAAAIADELRAAAPQEFRFKLRQANCQTKLGRQLRALGDAPAALRQLLPARDTLQSLVAQDAANAMLRADLHANLLALAEALLQADQHAGALEHWQQALAVAEQSAAAQPQDVNWRWRLIVSHEGLAHYCETLGADRRSAPAARLRHWRAGRDWRQRALAGWDDWDKQAISTRFNTVRREQAARLLARCEAQLNRHAGTDR